MTTAVDQILEALTGQMTGAEIAQATKVPVKKCHILLAYLKKDRKIRVVGTRYTGRAPAPVYEKIT